MKPQKNEGMFFLYASDSLTHKQQNPASRGLVGTTRKAALSNLIGLIGLIGFNFRNWPEQEWMRSRTHQSCGLWFAQALSHDAVGWCHRKWPDTAEWQSHWPRSTGRAARTWQDTSAKDQQRCNQRKRHSFSTYGLTPPPITSEAAMSKINKASNFHILHKNFVL